MSWEELAQLEYERIGVPNTPQFSYQELMAARSLVSTAKGLAEERKSNPEVDTPVRPRISRVNSVR
ncbi:MAG: hypothetical protein R3B91_05055 [Planctomycetaceae bacterium]